MKINKVLPILLAFSIGMGCKTVSKKDMMVTGASIKSESQEVWNRPTEIGFTMGKKIEGTSETGKLLGVLRVSGDETAGGLAIPTFGEAPLSPNAKWAVSNAVESANADGIYITKIVETRKIVFPVITKSATVYGYALKVKDFGPIEKSRADLDRMGHPPRK